ncbi:hypothetical protein DMENIID0001_056710 [Sergentomyia squamirostris]
MGKILISTSVVLLLLLGQTCAWYWNIVIGNRDPNDVLLGFTRGASNFTTTPQEHDLRLHFDGTPGNNITFVHVSIFPDYYFAYYPSLGQYYDFWIHIHMSNTTYLTAEMYVYGFPPTPGAQVEPEKPQHEAILTTIYNDKN